MANMILHDIDDRLKARLVVRAAPLRSRHDRAPVPWRVAVPRVSAASLSTHPAVPPAMP